MDKPQGVKERISSLKQYIKKIEEKLPVSHPQQKFTPAWRIPVRSVASAPPSEIATHLLKQISQLTERIEMKRKRFIEQPNSTEQILKQQTQIIPFVTISYISKMTPQGTLSSIVKKIDGDEWKKCSIYGKKNILIFVIDPTLQIIKLNLRNLQDHQISQTNNLIKFRTVQPDYFVILNISDNKMLHLWSTYLKSYQIMFIREKCINEKWQSTNIKSKIKTSTKISVRQDSEQQQYRINIKREKSVKNQLCPQKSKKSFSVTFKDPNFQKQLEEKDMLKISRTSNIKTESNKSFKSSEEDIKSSKGKKEGKMNFLDLKNSYSNQSKQSGEALSKLEQKKRRLIEQGKLNIHWDQQQDKSHGQHKQRVSIRQKKSSKKSISNKSGENLKNSSVDSKKESRSNEIAEKKRHDSETRGELDSRFQDDNVSRGGKTQIFPNRTKKYTDFHSQMFPDFSEQNAGSSTKKKQSIRRKILQSKIQKEMQLKEQQSKSSGNKNTQIKQMSQITIKTPQKIHFNEQEPNSKSILNNQIGDQSEDESFNSSNQQESQMDLHELKSGIVLWKCSVNGWKPHEKKLFLAESELEICYCDILDSREQKKFFIGDITNIVYGKEGNGIIQHFGNVEGQRCLIITIDNDTMKKPKQLEFYLGQNQAPESLKQFADKLDVYLASKNNKDEDQDDGDDFQEGL